ncbi:hypothetical protein CRG98_043173 [Punica granatum]|uniref:Uncharacterized protein n=1 Tax=Punica granatum TaxID=22663 RepID=A0A2I0HXG5_PUNGR|nr:hypothetical protein CRG98_043173 [Punica granatum]
MPHLLEICVSKESLHTIGRVLIGKMDGLDCCIPFRSSYFPVPPTMAIRDFSAVAVRWTPKKLMVSSNLPGGTTAPSFPESGPCRELLCSHKGETLPVHEDIAVSIVVDHGVGSGPTSPCDKREVVIVVVEDAVEVVGYATEIGVYERHPSCKRENSAVGLGEGQVAVWVLAVSPATTLSEGADPPSMSCIKKERTGVSGPGPATSRCSAAVGSGPVPVIGAEAAAADGGLSSSTSERSLADVTHLRVRLRRNRWKSMDFREGKTPCGGVVAIRMFEEM